MVVSGRAGDAWLDELSTLGREYAGGIFTRKRLCRPSAFSLFDFPGAAATLTDLAGGERERNAGIVRRLLRNEDHGPKRDAVLLNVTGARAVGRGKDQVDRLRLGLWRSRRLGERLGKTKLDELRH